MPENTRDVQLPDRTLGVGSSALPGPLTSANGLSEAEHLPQAESQYSQSRKEIAEFLALCTRDKFNRRLKSIKLNSSEYQLLLAEQKQSGFLHGIYWSYDRKEGILDLKMAETTLHSTLIGEIAHDLSRKLDKMKDDPELEPYTKNIHLGSGAIFTLSDLNNIKNRRKPDYLFRNDINGTTESAYPCLIIEVAYTQSSQSLEELALEYLRQSNGRIRTVIGFDVDYYSHATSFSVWRRGALTADTMIPRIKKIGPEVFRDAAGNYLDRSLKLRLLDFVDYIHRARVPSQSIDINSIALNRHLDYAIEVDKRLENANDGQSQGEDRAGEVDGYGDFEEGGDGDPEGPFIDQDEIGDETEDDAEDEEENHLPTARERRAIKEDQDDEDYKPPR